MANPKILSFTFSLITFVCNLNNINGMTVGTSSSNAPGSFQNSISFEATYVDENSILHRPFIQKYAIKSLGWFASGSHLTGLDHQSGVYDMQGKRTLAFGRSYNVITAENGQLVSKTFDVWAAGVKSLSEYLQIIPLGKSVIIASSDEPERNRLDAPLPDLIYQFGGSKKVFGESIKLHSAYVLFGARGIGESKGKEYYIGQVPSSVNSWVMTNFFVTGDQIIPESEVGLSLVDTLRVMGAKTGILPSAMVLSGTSKTKPMEVAEMEDKTTNKGHSKMKLSILF